MNKGKILTGAAMLLLGIATAAAAEDKSATGSNGQGVSGSATDLSVGNHNSSYSPGNPSPNNKIGDHPSSGNDKRGYSSDDAH